MPLFEDAQKLRLRGRGKRRDFVQHDGARAGHFQPAEFALDRSGKCAALVAEQFRFDKFLRQAGAIDFQERSVAAGAKFMDEAREMVFPGAAFAGDEQRRGGLRDFARQLDARPSTRDPRAIHAMRGSLILRPRQRR